MTLNSIRDKKCHINFQRPPVRGNRFTDSEEEIATRGRGVRLHKGTSYEM